VIFILKLLCNILVLALVYVSGTYVWHWVDINFFTTWREGNAWLMITSVTIAFSFFLASFLFSIVEALFSSNAARK
jgi:hypothetical protein